MMKDWKFTNADSMQNLHTGKFVSGYRFYRKTGHLFEFYFFNGDTYVNKMMNYLFGKDGLKS